MAKLPPNRDLEKVAPLPHDQENKVPKTPIADQPIQDAVDKITEPPKPGTALIDYKARLAALVAQTKKAESPQGGFLSTKNTRLSFGDVRLPNDTIRAIVIDYRIDNEFYPVKYTIGKTAFPTCHAVRRPGEFISPWREPREGEDLDGLVKSMDGAGMLWVADAEKPLVAAGVGCSDCKMMEFKSARFVEGNPPDAKGIACRGSRRLHLFAADQCTTPTDVDRAPSLTLIPPPTSLANFQKFANEVTTVMGLPIFGAVVDISVVPHDRFLMEVVYRNVEPIRDDGIMYALLRRHEVISLKDIEMPKADSSDAVKDQRGGKF